jgi:hypothetical protein
MLMWHLKDSAIESLLALPETGMGFQLVEAVIWGKSTPLLVLNSSSAIDLSQAELIPSDDPITILRNGARIVEAMRPDIVQTLMAAPEPHSFRLLSTRIGKLPMQISTSPPLHAAKPSSLVKRVSLPANRAFHRFSAFNPDRRVNPITGDFLPGTYAAPESEVAFVPTGFVAVGRFALPNNLPASYHYEIEAPPGTVVDFGTVAPAFGQAGGGVEAYFSTAVTNAKRPPTPMSKIPDE